MHVCTGEFRMDCCECRADVRGESTVRRLACRANSAMQHQYIAACHSSMIQTGSESSCIALTVTGMPLTANPAEASEPRPFCCEALKWTLRHCLRRQKIFPNRRLLILIELLSCFYCGRQALVGN